MAVELSTGVFATSLRPAITRPWCSASTLKPFYLLFLHFIYLSLQFLVNLLFILCIIFMYFQISYYRSTGHVVSECQIAFGNIHFLSELICLCTSTGIIITNLRSSFSLSTKFFISPCILTVFFGLFTNHSPGYVTITSHPKWRSTDRLFEKIFFSVITAFLGLCMHSFFIIL